MTLNKKDTRTLVLSCHIYDRDAGSDASYSSALFFQSAHDAQLKKKNACRSTNQSDVRAGAFRTLDVHSVCARIRSVCTRIRSVCARIRDNTGCSAAGSSRGGVLGADARIRSVCVLTRVDVARIRRA